MSPLSKKEHLSRVIGVLVLLFSLCLIAKLLFIAF